MRSYFGDNGYEALTKKAENEWLNHTVECNNLTIAQQDKLIDDSINLL